MTNAPPPPGSIRVIGHRPLGHHLGRAPAAVLAKALWAIVGRCGIALCLHRVFEGERREGELQPGLSISAAQLDRLLTLLRDARPSADLPLTASFDDGYLDAVRYVQSRAERFADIGWLVNICADKTRSRAGFRWDAYEQSGRPRELEPYSAFLEEDAVPARENEREDLVTLADDPRFELASVEECRALLAHPNVALGNHGNSHIAISLLDDETLEAETRASVASFEALFGETDHFTLPFGAPEVHYSPRQALLVAAISESMVWTTTPAPYRPRDCKPGAVLPRFTVVGDWTLAEILGVMITSSVKDRVRRARRRLRLGGVSRADVSVA